jgi:ABC-type transport system involved in multi-copper enzyme maturation permease subunit
MRSSRIAAIARYTVLEAVRTRLAILSIVLVVLLMGASFFVREIAIAESTRFQTALYAASVRFAAVFVIALHVITSIAREFQDKGLDVVLALDLPRSHYIVGKLAGFLAVCVALALFVSLPLVPLAGAEAAMQWGLSLAFELAMIAALALFCVVTFNNFIPAASFVLAFYLLARSLTTLRLISANPIAGAEELSHRVMTWLIEGLTIVIPPVDRWTQTSWLVDQIAPWMNVGAIAIHGIVLVVLLTAAAAFDMQRRNF